MSDCKNCETYQSILAESTITISNLIDRANEAERKLDAVRDLIDDFRCTCEMSTNGELIECLPCLIRATLDS